MTPFRRPRALRQPFSLVAAAVVTGLTGVRAATVTQNSSDPGGTTSFNAAGTWSDGLAPSAANDYVTAFQLRSPTGAGSATFAGNSLTINTSGSFLFKGTGTYTVNNLTVNGGSILHGDTGTTQIGTLAGNLTVGASGGTLTYNNGANNRFIHLNSVLSGSGALSVTTGPGTATGGYVRLAGNSTGYTGVISVNSLNVLRVGSNNGLGSATGNTVLNGSGTTGTGPVVAVDGTGLNVGEPLQFNVSTGRASLENLANANTWSGAITLSGAGGSTQAAALYATAGTFTVSGNIGGTTNGPFFLRGNGTGLVTGDLSVAGGMTLFKTDGSTWTVGTAGGTYSWGATQVANGTLRMGAANVLPSATTLTMGQGDTSTAILDLNGFSQTIGSLVLSTTGGTKQIGSATAATLTVNNATANTYAGQLGGTGANALSLTKTGAGSLTLSAVNTYAGTTTVSGGSIIATDPAALGTSAVVLNGGTLDMRQDAATAYGHNVSVSASSSLTPNRLVNGAGVTHTFGTLGLGAATLTVSSGAAMTSGTGGATFGATTLSGNGGLNVANGTGANTTVTIGGIAETGGARSFTKSGNGLLIVTGNSSHTGGTTVSGGTVQVGTGGTAGSLGTGAVSIGGGTTLRLQRSDTWTLPNDISGTGTLFIGNASPTVETDYVDLTGNNGGFTGPVTISMGGLRINDSNGLGTGVKTVTLTNGTSGNPHLRLNGSGGAIVLPSTISFTTSVQSNQGAIVNEAGNNSIAGAFTLTSGGGNTVINSLAGSLTLTGAMTFNQPNRSLALTGAAGGSVNGNILNGGQTSVGLVKDGTGTWTIGGTGNTYNGNTSITGGTLRLGAANVIPNGTGNGIVAMSPASGTATLDLNGFSDTIGGLSSSGAGSSVVNNGGASAVTLTVGDKGTDTTFNGSIQDSGGNLTLQKSGAGRLTLGGTSTFQGNILTPNVGGADHGKIRITSAAALGTGPKVVRQQTNQSAGVATLELFGGISTAANIDLEAAGHGTATTSPHLDSISGNNTWGGKYRIWNTGGAYFIKSSEAGSTLTIAGGLDNGISSTRSIQLYGAGDGVIGGPVTQTGGGALSLDFSGGIGAQPGAWRIDSTGNTYTGRTTVRKQDVLFGNTVLEIPTGQESTLGAPVAAANAIELDGGELRVTGSSLVLDDPGRHLSVGVNGGALDVGSGLTLTFANNVSASGAQLAKKGAGTLNLTGTVSVGQLSLTGGVTDINGATLRVNSLNQVGGSLVWGTGRVTVESTVGSSGSTDHTSPGYTAVRVGTTATVTGGLTSGAGSVLQAHGSPTFYLNGGVRFNQYTLSGILNLGSAGDILEVEINPYLLRPFSPNLGSTATDFGSIPLVTAAEIQGEFNSFTGVVNDGLGFDPYAGVFTSAAALPVNTWYLQYADTNADLLADTIFFHYNVSGYVPEPGTMALSVFGLAALRFLRRSGREDAPGEAPVRVRRERRRRTPRA